MQNMAITNKETNRRSIIIIGALFFIFGFVTWLNSVLIPYLQIACELSNFESYFVVFAFYISYLVMAIPSAWILNRTGFKKGMSLGLLIMAFGAVIFVPAAINRAYEIFLLGLFVQGTGLALLQTAANPYITIIGPLESAAKRISIMGICNKVAGALAPIILGAIALQNIDSLISRLDSMETAQRIAELDALSARVITPYIIMTTVLVSLAIMIFYSSLPELQEEKEGEIRVNTNESKTNIFQFPHLLLGTLAMFLYIGVEVIAGDTVISYGLEQGISAVNAKFFTTYTLIAMIVGYLVGIVTIPRYINQAKALKISGILGIILGLSAIHTSGFISVLFISLLGLANALVFPAIWPLALAGLGKFTKIGSSFLIMALSGGAILPLVYGWVADLVDPKQAYWIVIPCYIFILFFSTNGYKIGKERKLGTSDKSDLFYANSKISGEI